MSVNIHGKEYTTVAERIAAIHKDGIIKAVETKFIGPTDGKTIIMQAIVTTDKGVFMGTAEEIRGSEGISGSSPVEVAETSAVGRALAFAGYLGSTPIIASADEMASKLKVNAVTAEDVQKVFPASQEIFTCKKCAKVLEDKGTFKAKQIASFSKRKYGKELCLDCQKELG